MLRGRLRRIVRIAAATAVLLIGFAGGLCRSVESFPLTPEYWIRSGSNEEILTVLSTTPDDRENMMRVEAVSGDYPGVTCSPPKNWSPYGAFALTVYSESENVAFAIRIDSRTGDSGRKKFFHEFNMKKGEQRIVFQTATLAEKIDIHSIVELVVYLDKPPAGTVFWMYDCVLSEATDAPPLKTDWTRDPKAMKPFNFEQLTAAQIAERLPPRDPLLATVVPDDNLVLFHKYEGSRADVLDFSGHGSLGEFLTADRMQVSKNNFGLRLHGDIRSGRPQGYRIMGSSRLVLKEGAISLWMWADPDYRKEGVLIASEADARQYISVKADRKGAVEIKSTLTSNKPIKVKETVSGWFHLAISFGPDGSALYINGKKVGGEKSAGALNGAMGFQVGRNEKLKKGFAGSIDELKIFSRRPDGDPGAGEAAVDRFNPSGLVLHYDFQETGGNPTVIHDVSGNGLDGTASNIRATGVAVDEKSAPNKNDLAWEFYQNNENFSYILLPRHDSLDLAQGTIILYYNLEKMTTGGWPRRTLVGIGSPETGGCRYTIDHLSFHPNTHKDLDPKEVTPFYLLNPGGAGLDREEVPLMLHNNTWNKFVIAWDRNGTTVWVNDMKCNTTFPPFEMFGSSAPIILGASLSENVENAYPSHVLFSDVKILGYKLTTYTKDVVGATEKKWRAAKPLFFKLDPRPASEQMYGKENPW